MSWLVWSGYANIHPMHAILLDLSYYQLTVGTKPLLNRDSCLVGSLLLMKWFEIGRFGMTSCLLLWWESGERLTVRRFSTCHITTHYSHSHDSVADLKPCDQHQVCSLFVLVQNSMLRPWLISHSSHSCSMGYSHRLINLHVLMSGVFYDSAQESCTTIDTD